MSESASTPNQDGVFKTINTVDLWIDEPGDHTVRPSRRILRERAHEEREKLRGKDAQPPDVSSPPDTSSQPPDGNPT